MAPVSVRYIVEDVDAAVAFYSRHPGFGLEFQPASGLAIIARGDLRLLLNAEIDDLDARVNELRAAGVQFRNELVTGKGGKQILLEDPSGNPVELFQPTSD